MLVHMMAKISHRISINRIIHSPITSYRALALAIVCLWPGILPAQPAADLQHMKQKYPDESVIVLSKKETVEIDIVNDALEIYNQTYSERLFLDDKAGLFSKMSVEYSGFDPILDMKATTWVPGKKKYKPVPVENIYQKDVLGSSIFHDDIRAKYFVYPALAEGVKTELVYKQQVKEPRFFGSFIFGSLIPVEKAEFMITTHKDVALDFKYFNINEADLQFEKKLHKEKVIYHWVMNDIPKQEMEAQSRNIRYRIPHVIVYIRSYGVGESRKTVLENVGDLYQWYFSLVKDINEEDDPILELLVDSLTQNVTEETEKVKRIYNWVKDNIKYIAFEDGLGGFIPRHASMVCERRFGDCKDMSSIITEMLNIAGIESHITWIGTRDIPYSYREVPTPIVDNHMIATYFKDGRYYFLDATSRNTPFGLPTAFIQEKEALVGIDSANYRIVKVPAVDYRKNRVVDSVDIQIVDQMISGTGRSRYEGYFKEWMTDKIADKTEKERLKVLNEELRKGSNKSLLKNAVTQNQRDRDLRIDYAFEVQDYPKFNQDEIYINMNLERPFRSEQIKPGRKNPMAIRFKSLNEFSVKLDCPEGYSVHYTPENVNFHHDHFGFDLNYHPEKDHIRLDLSVYNNFLVLEQDHFDDWNKMVRQLGKAYSEVVILKKNKP